MSKTQKFNPDSILSRGMDPLQRMEVGKVLNQAKRAADQRHDDRNRADPQPVLPEKK